MEFLKRHESIAYDINISPLQADVAIVSINYEGREGRLNRFVMEAYGYTVKDLPDKKTLKDGFALLKAVERRSIIFVVTVDPRNVTLNFGDNLSRALFTFASTLIGKKIWVPLLGNGDGGFALEESYSITVNAINKFLDLNKERFEFLVAIPNVPEGIDLLKFLRELDDVDTSKNVKLKPDEQKSSGKTIRYKGDPVYIVESVSIKEGDLAPKFYKESIWQDATLFGSAPLLNSIEKNSILILRWARNPSVKDVHVRAIGVVTDNPGTGDHLNVRWHLTELRDIYISVETFAVALYRLNPEIALTIFERLTQQQLDVLFPKPGKDDTLPGITSDAEIGVDYLDIASDVNAFAKVITAKNYPPPLAIALFGKWGSGKSFFMKKLKDRIKDLADDTTGVYCDGVAQIHFNAWSYIDCNLWASIVTRIFDGLQEYISDQKNSDAEKKEIEHRLTSELSIVKGEKDLLESERAKISLEIKSLERTKNGLESELHKKISEVQSRTLWSAITKADEVFGAKKKTEEALAKNQSFTNSIDEIKRLVPHEYWNNPEKAYELAKSRGTFLKAFFNKEVAVKNSLVLIGIVLLVVLAPPLLQLFIGEIRAINFFVPQALIVGLTSFKAIWDRSEKVYNELQPMISSFWEVKMKHEEAIEKATAQFEQTEKALKLEIEKRKAQVLQVQEQIIKAETKKTDLEFRIKNTVATEALYSFIDKRSKTDEYRKYLGIISTIRKDFEILNTLFTDHNAESRKIDNVEEFRKKFKKPLERIVLYIDDLDRCPEDNVVQVLEAVNLLMAFPLFVVVVGVDSRWIKNALRKKHSLQFMAPDKSHPDAAPEDILEPSNYLEKIFQVAFHLKDARDENVKSMIRNLAKGSNATTGNPSNVRLVGNLALGVSTLPITKIDLNTGGTGTNTGGQQSDGTLPVTAPSKPQPPKPLEFDEKEIKAMEDLWDVVGSNPRAIKRFVNTYRIVRAHENFEFDVTQEQQVAGILFLIALPLGSFKPVFEALEGFIDNVVNKDKSMDAFLASPPKAFVEVTKLKADMGTRPIYTVLQSTSVSLLKTQHAFLRRFTFRNL